MKHMFRKKDFQAVVCFFYIQTTKYIESKTFPNFAPIDLLSIEIIPPKGISTWDNHCLFDWFITGLQMNSELFWSSHFAGQWNRFRSRGTNQYLRSVFGYPPQCSIETANCDGIHLNVKWEDKTSLLSSFDRQHQKLLSHGWKNWNCHNVFVILFAQRKVESSDDFLQK